MNAAFRRPRVVGHRAFDASRRTFLLLHLSGDALTPAFTCVTHDDFEERDYVSARWQLRRTVLLPTGASRAIRVRRRFAQFDGRRRTSSTGEWVRYTLDGTHFVDAGGAFVCPDDTPERDAAGGADAAGD